MEERKQAANRNYKDSVFVDLFSEDTAAKENFLSLYNALHNTHLDNVSALTPLRLEQGKSLGLAEGKSLGSRQAKLETARLMLQRNYSTAEICLMTGLTEVEVETMCN
ncbi:MAG: hypothetical protein ACTTI6_04635 [Treponema sp.]|uniref:hypothetical protein n=1 Tax=Treponema sp. TaxID=166 RepID=UPI003FA221A7